MIRRRPVISPQNTFATFITELQDALNVVPDPETPPEQGERIRALFSECDRMQAQLNDFPNRAIPFIIRKMIGKPHENLAPGQKLTLARWSITDQSDRGILL